MKNSCRFFIKSFLFIGIVPSMLLGCGGGGGGGSDDISGEYEGTLTPTVVECSGDNAPIHEVYTIAQSGTLISAQSSVFAIPTLTGTFNPNSTSTITGKDDTLVCSFVEGGHASYQAKITQVEEDTLSVEYSSVFKCDNSKESCHFSATGVFTRK